MKRIFSILAMGLALTACGEQFQGSFQGQAVLINDSCGQSTSGQFVNFTMSMRLSGNDAEFLITEFERIEQNSVISTDTKSYIRGTTFRGDIVGDNQITTSDVTYELSEVSQARILANLDDAVTEAERQEIEEDEIVISGSLRSDRKVIETFQVQIQSQEVSGGVLNPCLIEFEADQNGLVLVE